MAHSVKIVPRQQLGVIRFAGLVARGDFDEVWRALSESPDFNWDFDEITVFGPDADVANLNFESVNAEALRFKTSIESVTIQRRRRSAIVVSSQVQALNARMFLAYLATNPPPHVEYKLFDKVRSGLTWIEAGRPPGDPSKKIDAAEVERTLAELQSGQRANGASRQAKAG